VPVGLLLPTELAQVVGEVVGRAAGVGVWLSPWTRRRGSGATGVAVEGFLIPRGRGLAFHRQLTHLRAAAWARAREQPVLP
jgi:hypothetical protein